MAVRPHRPAAVLLGVMAVLSTAACSGASTASPARGPDTPKVALVVANRQLNFSREMADGYRAGVREVGGVEADVTGPDIVDGPRELQLFQTAAAGASGGVSLFTLDPDLFIESLTSVTGRGLPVIAVDNPAPLGSGVHLFVGNDNLELGRMLADAVISRLPDGATGTVVVGTSTPGAPVLDRRAEGIREELESRLPGVKVLGPFDSKQEVGANLAAWRTLVKANPKALAFLGTGDADGWDLAAVRAETRGKWLAGAFDLDPKALAAVKAGHLLLVSPEHFLKGALAGRLQASHAKGSAQPKGWVYVPGLVVTPDNVDAVIARQASPATREAALRPQIDDILDHLPQRLRPIDQAG